MKYSKNIYPGFAITETAQAYSGICTTHILEDDEYWIVYFSEYVMDSSLLIREFSNYLIDVINGAD